MAAGLLIDSQKPPVPGAPPPQSSAIAPVSAPQALGVTAAPSPELSFTSIDKGDTTAIKPTDTGFNVTSSGYPDYTKTTTLGGGTSSVDAGLLAPPPDFSGASRDLLDKGREAAGNLAMSDSVSDQLQGLLKDNSPYIKMAQTLAKQQSNARGIPSSTMAAEAGVNAAIRAGLPIAQQDAATGAAYRQAAQGAEYQQGAIERGAVSDWYKTQLQNEYDLKLNSTQTEGQLQLQRERLAAESYEGAQQRATQIASIWENAKAQGQLSAQDAQQLEQMERLQHENRLGLMRAEYVEKGGMQSAEFDHALTMLDKDYVMKNWLGDMDVPRQIQLNDALTENQKRLMIAEYNERTNLAKVEGAIAYDQMLGEYGEKSAMLAQEYVERGKLTAIEATEAIRTMKAEYGEKNVLADLDSYRKLIEDERLNAHQKDMLLTEYAEKGSLQWDSHSQELEAITARGDEQLRAISAEYAERIGLSEVEAENALEYLRTEYGERSDMSTQEYEQAVLRDTNLNDLQKDYALHDLGIRADFERYSTDLKKELMVEEANQNIRLADIQAWNDQNLQLLKGDQAESLARIEADYKTMMQTSASATDFYKQIQDNITKIQLSDDIKPEVKDQYIQSQLDGLETGMGLIGAIGNINLGDLLVFPDPMVPVGDTGNTSPGAGTGTAPPPGQQNDQGYRWIGGVWSNEDVTGGMDE